MFHFYRGNRSGLRSETFAGVTSEPGGEYCLIAQEVESTEYRRGLSSTYTTRARTRGVVLHMLGGWRERTNCYDFSTFSFPHAYLPRPRSHSRFVSHVTFPSTVTLLFIITCRCGPSSPLSQTLTHYACLLISDALYDTLTRYGRPFPGLSCI